MEKSLKTPLNISSLSPVRKTLIGSVKSNTLQYAHITFVMNTVTSSNKTFPGFLRFIPARPFPAHWSAPESADSTVLLCGMPIHSVTYLILELFLIMSASEFNTK